MHSSQNKPNKTVRIFHRLYFLPAELKVISIPIADFSPPTLEQVQQFLDVTAKGKKEKKVHWPRALCYNCDQTLSQAN